MCSSVMFLFVCMLVFTCGLFTTCNAGNPSHEEHIRRVTSFECKQPQMRAVKVLDEVPRSTDEIFFPPVTVLHRCDSQSGCCLQSQFACAPAHTEDVEVTFLIKNIVRGHRSRPRYETIKMQNHTLCSCQATSAQPK